MDARFEISRWGRADRARAMPVLVVHAFTVSIGSVQISASPFGRIDPPVVDV